MHVAECLWLPDIVVFVLIEKGVDKTASELAIARLQEESSRLVGRDASMSCEVHERTINHCKSDVVGLVGSLMALAVGFGPRGIVFLLIGIGLVILADMTSSTTDQEKQLSKGIAEKDVECIFVGSDRWTPVVRYDTAHGFTHRMRCILEEKL